MSYSFCFGPSGSGKSHYLRKMIIERAGKSLSSLGKDRTKYIVIVPEQYSMQTQHELIDEDPRHVLMNVDVSASADWHTACFPRQERTEELFWMILERAFCFEGLPRAAFPTFRYFAEEYTVPG